MKNECNIKKCFFVISIWGLGGREEGKEGGRKEMIDEPWEKL